MVRERIRAPANCCLLLLAPAGFNSRPYLSVFFCLDAKEPKDQGCNASLKMNCVPLKCPNSLRLCLRSNSGHFLTLHSIHFFNAAALRPIQYRRIFQRKSNLKAEVSKHQYFVRYVGDTDASSFSYIFHLPGDKSHEVQLEIMAFHHAP